MSDPAVKDCDGLDGGAQKIRFMGFGETFTFKDIAGARPDRARDSIKRFVQRGLIKPLDGRSDAWQRLPKPAKSYERNTTRARAWRAIRVRGARFEAFTADEIARVILDDEQNLHAVKMYVRALQRSGYLEEIHTNVFRLMDNTGPLAPVVLARSAYDPNKGGEREWV